MKETVLAKELLNAVYEEDIKGVENILKLGADASWIFNGYPILIHAVYLENEEIAMCLIKNGAVQVREALGFALEQGIGSMVCPLAFMGITPKALEPKQLFGEIPSRFAPTSLSYTH